MSAARWQGRDRLFGYRYDGFWKPADTFKERAELDDRIPSWRSTVDGVGARRRRSALGSRRRGPMIQLSTGALTEIAVVGAHCDDIAIGMGGTLLTLARADPGLRVRGLVLSGGGTEREAEELDALAAFCPGADVERDRPRHTGRASAGALGTNQESPE